MIAKLKSVVTKTVKAQRKNEVEGRTIVTYVVEEEDMHDRGPRRGDQTKTTWWWTYTQNTYEGIEYVGLGRERPASVREDEFGGAFDFDFLQDNLSKEDQAKVVASIEKAICTKGFDPKPPVKKLLGLSPMSLFNAVRNASCFKEHLGGSLPGVTSFSSRLTNVSCGWWFSDDDASRVVEVVNVCR